MTWCDLFSSGTPHLRVHLHHRSPQDGPDLSAPQVHGPGSRTGRTDSGVVGRRRSLEVRPTARNWTVVSFFKCQWTSLVADVIVFTSASHLSCNILQHYVFLDVVQPCSARIWNQTPKPQDDHPPRHWLCTKENVMQGSGDKAYYVGCLVRSFA